MIPLAVIALFLLVGTAARAQTADQLCASPDSSGQERITACTGQIQSGTLTAKDLSLAYTNRGRGYVATGQDELAMSDYNQALQLNPDSQRAYFNRGNLYSRKGQYDLAIADFTQAVRIAPRYQDAFNNRGIAYKEKGQLELAIDDFGEALSLNGTSAVFYNIAFVYYLTGRDDIAVIQYAQALRLDPAASDAYAGRAFAFIDTDRFSDAERDLASALKLAPTWAEGVLWLHIARARAGDNDASEFVANAAAFDSTKWPAPLVNFYLGKTTALLAISAAATEPQRCEARFYIAEWRLANKQLDGARSGFQEAARICPPRIVESFEAQRELRRMARF
jgi:lipoprotein NlpI